MNAVPIDDPRWKILSRPFAEDEVATMPRPFSKDSPKSSCKECGGWHGQPAVHLSYVGHADVTTRLNEADPLWSWEPMALTPAGTPFGSDGGLWIRLTVLGHTRLGFGDAQGKTGPNAIKEMIGDAIRNAAMRFGVATYLWSKSDRAKAQLEVVGADPDGAPAPAREVAAEPAHRMDPRVAEAGAALTPGMRVSWLDGLVADYGMSRDPAEWTPPQVTWALARAVALREAQGPL